jgi:hypothetical protein
MLPTWIDLHSPSNPERRTCSRVGAKQVKKRKNLIAHSSIVDGIGTLALEQIPLICISHFPKFCVTCIYIYDESILRLTRSLIVELTKNSYKLIGDPASLQLLQSNWKAIQGESRPSTIFVEANLSLEELCMYMCGKITTRWVG